MKTTAKKILAFTSAGALALAIGVGTVHEANAQAVFLAPHHRMERRERHPVILRSRNMLIKIDRNLGKAPHDFQGHKAQAMKLIEEATEQLNLAIKADHN